MKRLKTNDYYGSLLYEYHQALPVILQHHTVGEEIVNAVGKRLPIFTEKGRRKKQGDLLPQVLFGYEAWR